MPNISMSAAIRQTLEQILNDDKKAFLIGEDIGVYGGAFKITQGFVEKFGENRIVDTPIAENGFVGIACGAALMGSRPIAEIMFMDFLPLALDGIINGAVKWQEIYGDEFTMPIIIRTPAGAGRSYGPTHSQSFEGLLLNVPNLTICCPSNAADAAGMLLGAYEACTPTIFIEHKALYAKKAEVPARIQPIPLGKANVICEGDELTMISYGRPLLAALDAADQLRDRGHSIEVIDLRSIKPLDRATVIESLCKTGRGMSIEESPVIGGVGAELSAIVMEDAFGYLEAPFSRLGAAEKAIPCSPALEAACFPTTSEIVAKATALLEF